MTPITVVSICREKPRMTLRFLDWHKTLGARVRLYLDDPEDPALPEIETRDWVEPIRCTPEYWRTQGYETPPDFQTRQLVALTDGYKRTATGWVAVCDADELFWLGGRSFDDILAPLPAEVESLRLGTAELVRDEGETLHFRLPMTREQCNSVYKDRAGHFTRNHGLVGHVEGKSITRAGLDIWRIHPHWALRQRDDKVAERFLPATPDLALLHLNNPDYESFRRKLDWRMSARGISRHTKEAVLQAQASEDPERAIKLLFNQLYRGSPKMLARLQRDGVYLGVDVAAAMANPPAQVSP